MLSSIRQNDAGGNPSLSELLTVLIHRTDREDTISLSRQAPRIWLVAGATDIRKSLAGLGERLHHVLDEGSLLRPSVYLPGTPWRYRENTLG